MNSEPASDSEWLSDSEGPLSGRRGAPRLRLSLPAKLVTLSDTRRCILMNLSRTGAQVGMEIPMRKGEDTFLQLAGIDQFGTVVRQEIGPSGGFNGIRFEEPLSDEEVLAVRHFSETFAEDALRSLRREVHAWVNGIS